MGITTSRDLSVTEKVEAGTDRFGELLAEYKRMKGVAGDQLGTSTMDLYTGLLADALHYALKMHLNYVLAFAEAYRVHLEESTRE